MKPAAPREEGRSYRGSGTPSLVLVAAAVPLLTACAGGEVTTLSPEEGPSLDRDALEVTVRVSEEDSTLASALRWEDRRVPGARVTLIKETATTGIALEDSITGETETDGTVRFTELLPGTTYRVKLYRPLRSDETAQVETGRPGIRVLAGGTKAPSGSAIEVTVDANRTGSLVFSEVVALLPASGQPGAGYDFASYIELYNNSDRTIALDGMVLGRALSFHRDLTSRPCQETRSFQTSGTGIWSQFFQAFPGSGGEHTVPPGETVVVATDAIDHSEVAPSFPNLRNADFEFTGPSDVDNPNVPNMRQVGLRSWFFGHGLSALAFSHFSMRIFLSEPVEVAALERGRPDPADDDIFVHFPAKTIVDVTTTVSANPFEGRKYCTDLLPDRFEKLGKVWTDRITEEGLVHIRQLAGEREDRQPILLDTNTSAVDFRWGTMSPDGLGTR